MSKIMIVSFWAGEIHAVGSNRVNAFIKYLDSLGWEVVVLYPNFASKNIVCRNKYFFDESVLVDGIKYYKLSGWSFFAWLQNKMGHKHQNGEDRLSNLSPNGKNNIFNSFLSGIKKILSRFFYHFIQALAFPDDVYWGWFRSNRKKVLDVVVQEKPDIVLTSALPISSHCFGALIHDKFNIPWVADFRDYYAYGLSPIKFPGVEFLKRAWLARKMKNAHAVISVTQGLAKGIQSQIKKQVSVIYNGHEPEKIKQTLSSTMPSNLISNLGRIYGCYCGRIYPAQYRMFKRFLKWVLVNSNFFINRNYCFVIMGPTSEEARNMVTEVGGGQLLRLFRFLDKQPPAVALQCQAASRILLHYDYGQDGILSGKVFEYFYYEKPILLFSQNDHSELSNLLRDNGSMIVLEHDSDSKSLEDIEKLLQTFSKHRKMLEKYTRAYQSRRLSELLKCATGEAI